MAAKASGTWLKVASKGGGAKSVFVSNKLGGRAFNEGETITQSELNAHLATASKALEKQGIDAKARFPGTYKQATAKAGSSSSDADMAKLAAENIQSSQRQKQAIADWNNYKSSMTGSSSAGKKKGDRQQRISQIRENINDAAAQKREQIWGKGNKGITLQKIAKFERSKEGKRQDALFTMDRKRMEATPSSGGSGNRAAKAAGSLAERRKRQILANGTPAQKAAIKRREAKQKAAMNAPMSRQRKNSRNGRNSEF